MRKLTFYGSSDDLFEIEGTAGKEPDEIGSYDKPVQVTIRADGTGVVVTGIYCDNGCWSIGIAPIDEDVGLPDWPMRWTARGYSTRLEIDAPDKAKVSAPKDQ